MMRKTFIALFGVIILGGLGFGAPGMIGYLRHGHLATNSSSLVPWGLWVAAYVYFIGLSAGAFLVSTLVFVFHLKQFERIGRLAVVLALITLLLALASIGLDIGHPERAWHVWAWPNFGSPMAWMIWLYTAYAVLLVAEAYLLMRRDALAGRARPGIAGMVNRLLSLGMSEDTPEGRRRDLRMVRVLAAVGIPLAVMFHGGVGALFGVLASRPFWHTGLYPILFLVSAILSGGAAIAAVSYVFLDEGPERQEAMRSLGAIVLALLVFEALWEIAEALAYLYGGMPSHAGPWRLLLAGQYAPNFWIAQVGVGTMLPILLLWVGLRRPSAEMIAAACALVVVAFLFVRLNVILPAMTVEEIRGLTEAYSHPRWSTAYVPSLGEWQVTAFITGVGGVLLALSWRWLPLRARGPAAASEAESI